MSDNILFGKFVELDNQCRELLGNFYEWMKAPHGAGLKEQEASDLAHAADRYLRDFVVDIKELPPTKSDISTVRQYLGNWYPINTLEPSHEEVDRISKALALFHGWAKSGDILDCGVSDGVIELEQSYRLPLTPAIFAASSQAQASATGDWRNHSGQQLARRGKDEWPLRPALAQTFSLYLPVMLPAG